MPVYKRTTAPISTILLSFVSGLALLCVCPPPHAVAQTPADFNVNSVADKVDATPGDGICSTGSTVDGHAAECTLRAAIDEANALSAANPSRLYTISVMSGTYNLTTSESCTYTDFGSHPMSTNTAVLCISGNMTLNGADQATTIVDHAQIGRDFFVSAGYTAAINNMTIQNGAQYGGTYDGGGGGVNNQGVLTLSNDLFTRNTSQVEEGGAVYNAGTLVVEGSTFAGNTGDAIVADYALTSINDSYFTGNTSYYGGAAVYVYAGSLSLSNSTVTGNTVSSNGIISSYGATATITNSTISGNTIGNAGAVVGSGSGNSMTLNNVTIAANTAGNSIGGLFAGPVTMSNTILAGNSGYDCAVTGLVDLGHNLIQVPESGICTLGATTLTGVDAKLGPVTTNAGQFPTQEPLAGSPAIGAGSKATPGSGSGACAALDEIGFVRAAGACTIGAVEPLGSFAIADILPNLGSPGGTADIAVNGNGFVAGSTLAIKNSAQAIPLLQFTVEPNTRSIAAQLDLSRAAAGSYDVVVTTPAGVSTTLPGAYTVAAANATDIYSYVLGPGAARPDRPSYYTVIYGNRGNSDAYLVPLTLGLPGNYAGLILSPVLPPPPASGQAITDWTSVPVEVAPYSTTATTNVPLLVPVIPANSQGVLRFSLTPPAGSKHGDTFTFFATLGDPYGNTPGGAVDATVLSELVAGAQTYAQTNLGATLTPAAIAQMSTYGASQLQQVEAMGQAALVSSAQGRPVFFDTAQLSIDVAAYGAKLVSGSSASRPAGIRPDGGGGAVATPPSNPCTGQVMAPGTSCGDVPTPAPTPANPPLPGSISRDDCMALPGHHVSQYGSSCVPNNPHGCAIIANPMFADSVNCGYFPIEVSLDPNEKDGPLGIGATHFTLAADPFAYQVEFENSPMASGAAQTVSVTDPLDTTKYDLSTFQLGPISFGPYVLTPPPGLTSYTSALDLRPTENVIVAVAASLNTGTGVATWNFTSLDPATLQLVTDATAGFLPPDTNPPAGIGHVAFSIKPLPSLESSATICNTASIVFDTNAAIATAPFCNSKDTTAPVSSVEPLPATENSETFTVSWTGTDAGVGIAFYTIYASIDGGAFNVWQSATANTSASYTGSAGHSYGFYSIATDLLGNTEAAKTKAEATTAIGTGQQAQTIAFGTLANHVYGATPLTLTATATSGLPVSYTVTGPAKLSGSTLTITGAGTVFVTASQAGNANFSAAAPVTQGFTVASAPLTVTAESVSRSYGAANPTLSYAITGFVDGDGASTVTGDAILSTIAVATSPAGTYPIRFSTEALTAVNYSFAYVPGTLTILAPEIIATTTTLVANPDTSLVAGEPVTLTATVVAASGTVIPAGTITFASPSGGSVTVSLDKTGRAIYKGLAPPVGTYSVSARYSGSAGFAGSTSVTITRTVTAPPTR